MAYNIAHASAFAEAAIEGYFFPWLKAHHALTALGMLPDFPILFHPIANSLKHRRYPNDPRPARPLLCHGSRRHQLLPRGRHEPRAGSCSRQDGYLCVYKTPVVFRVLLVGGRHAVYAGESGVCCGVCGGSVEVLLKSDQR